MATKLLIVESPAKAKTIQKYLGPGYKVAASMGHVRDLPKSKLGVDVEHNFEPDYEVSSDKSKIVAELRSAARKADAIYLATDPDREGEAIAWHVLEALGAKKNQPVFRVTFQEITRNAVQHAVAHPRQIDMRLVDAQQARRVLDRLVGYRLSPLLWDKVQRGLSAGRVQSVAVRLVVEREREIEGFKPQEYWTIEADLQKQAGDQRVFRAVLIERAGKKLGKFDIANQEAAEAIRADLDGAGWRVAKITRKDKRRTPAPPFTTSTLQQEASRKLGFGAKKTMIVAQQLYEGVDLGSEGTVGLITYMRTDSVSVSKEAQDEARELVAEMYGREYVPERPNTYRTKSKGAQEAHEAIRPTSSRRIPDRVRNALNREQQRLYDLIWKRFVASQMEAAIFDSTTVDIAARKDQANGAHAYIFRSTGSVLKFPGFLRVYNVDLDEGEEDEDREAVLPPLNESELLKLLDLLALQHWTQPPPRFTEASLVKELERLGIGRPSTYAPTISTIETRNYIEIVEKKLLPTDLGRVVTDMLVEHFGGVIDYNFTSELEQKLDDIAEGEREWVPVIRDFYGPFDDTLRKAERDMRSVKGEARVIDQACPTCGSPLAIRLGRNGEFLACTNSECQFTGDLERRAEGDVRLAQPPELAEGAQTCDKCSRPMLVKQGRYGPFLACTGYPECKNIRNLTKTREGTLAVAEQATEWNCPKCSKPMIRKQGRWGPYLACTDYPDCRTIQKLDREGRPKPPAKITERVCPQCNQHQLALKEGRYGPFLSCTGYPKCRYIEKLPADGSTPRILSDEEVEALRPAKTERPAAASKRKASKPAAKKSTKPAVRASNGSPTNGKANGKTNGRASTRTKTTRPAVRETAQG